MFRTTAAMMLGSAHTTSAAASWSEARIVTARTKNRCIRRSHRLQNATKCVLVIALGLTAAGDRAGEQLSGLDMLPILALPAGAGRIVVEEAQAAFIAVPNIPRDNDVLQTDRAVAVGRSYAHRYLDAPILMGIAAHAVTGWVVHAGEGNAFDLWELATKRSGHDNRAAIRLAFRLSMTEPTKLWLGLGSSDNCAVVVDDRLVYLVRGERHRRRNQDTIPLQFSTGAHEIALISWKAQPWNAVPSDHFTDDWAIEAQLYRTAEAAWAERNLTNFHVLDTPVVRAISDIRAEGSVAGHDQATLVGLDSNAVAHGSMSADGSLRWSAMQTEPGPFVGFLVLGDDVVEPLVITDGKSLELVGDERLRQCAGREDSSAWPLRVRHLLKSDFTNKRDAWWARKFAVSLLMACTKRDNTVLAPLLSRCGAAQIHFDEFSSQIDGTRQYYRTYLPPNGGASMPVAVVLPTAPSQVRPHLYSYQVADLIEAENWASAAREAGIALFWPSYVDVDYGGLYARRNLAEGLNAFANKYPALARSKRYLIGFCSAAVAALGYSTMGGDIDGLVLCTPVVQRPLSRWFKGVPVDPLQYPKSAMAREDWFEHFPRLTNIPTYVNYDADVEGHGDPKGARALIERLQAARAPVEAYWPDNPDKVFVWGTRARDRAIRLFHWIKTKTQEPDLRPQLARLNLSVRTVKEALLGGYRVELPKDPADRKFLDWWTGILEQYRGEKPRVQDVPIPNAAVVQFGHLTSDALQSIKSGTWLSGKVTMGEASNDMPSLDRQSQIWGFRLRHAVEGHRYVDVVRSKGAGDEFPRIDPIVDGSCTGAVFIKNSNGWQLLQIGIPK